MPGAFGKGTFLDMFNWVREKGYEGDEHFQKYHARDHQRACTPPGNDSDRPNERMLAKTYSEKFIFMH